MSDDFLNDDEVTTAETGSDEVVDKPSRAKVVKKTKVLKCNLRRNGKFYKEGEKPSKGILKELEELGFIKEV